MTNPFDDENGHWTDMRPTGPVEAMAADSTEEVG